MKEHIVKIGMLIASLMMICGCIYIDYKKEKIDDVAVLYFQIGEETIQTWENGDTQYLFLPSFVKEEDVVLAPYSPEFYLIKQGRTMEKNEDIHQIAKGKKIDCQFLKGGEKFKLCILQSENVPAIFMHTNSDELGALKADKEYMISGSLRAVKENGEWQEKLAIRSIKGRGNTSFAGYEKKPFSITLQEENSVLGLPGGRKYALISNASDGTLIRNDIARRMEMALELSYSHAGQFVDLYMNGEYEGNYYLCDDIEIGEERVNITNMEAVMNLFFKHRNYQSLEIYETDDAKARIIEMNPKDITGGYLIEREYGQRYEQEYADITSGFITNEKEHFVVKNPAFCSVEQIEYIRRFVNDAEAAIVSEDGMDARTQKGYQEYIDVDSFVKKYLVEEVSKNYDAGVSSSYFYKDSNSKNGKLCAGPGWDYDMSMGNYVDWMEEFSANPTGISQLAFHTYASSWYTQLYQKEEFYKKIEDNYWKYVEPFLEELIVQGIDQYEDFLRASAGMNEVRWAEELKKNPYYTNREQRFVDLKDFLQQRKEFLDEAWSLENS